jgi:hypothetical protein
MNRGAHAINAADSRMDRDSEKARQAEADALMAQAVASTLSALLGGLAPARATKTALALADGALDAYAAHTDGPMAAAWCGKKAGQLCGDIGSPGRVRRMSALETADRVFSPANDRGGVA